MGLANSFSVNGVVYAFSEEVHAIGATVLVVDFTGDGGESHREWTADYVGIPQNNEEAVRRLRNSVGR